MEDNTRIMGIDFGERRVGLALSDPLKMFSYPHETIINDENFFKNLLDIIKEQSVEKIVMGCPFRDDNQITPVIEKIYKLKEDLEKALSIEVILWDEAFTSHYAQKKIVESVKSKKKRREKGLLDRHSAAIILQEYLNG